MIYWELHAQYTDHEPDELDPRVVDAHNLLELSRATNTGTGCAAIALTLAAGIEAVPAGWINKTIDETELLETMAEIVIRQASVEIFDSTQDLEMILHLLSSVPQSGAMILSDNDGDGQPDHAFGLIKADTNLKLFPDTEFLVANGVDMRSDDAFGMVAAGINTMSREVLEEILGSNDQMVQAYVIMPR